MRVRSILLVLLFISITSVVFPLFRTNLEVPLVPEETQLIYLSINRPTLKFSTTISNEIKLNISKYDAKLNVIEIIGTNLSIKSNLEIRDLSPGQYQISLISSNLGEITIGFADFYLPSLVLFAILVVINIYNLYVKLEEN